MGKYKRKREKRGTDHKHVWFRCQRALGKYRWEFCWKCSQTRQTDEWHNISI